MQVTLRNNGDHLALTVPGLSEGRPSVLIGDRVILSDGGLLQASPQYEGFVHEVCDATVRLALFCWKLLPWIFLNLVL